MGYDCDILEIKEWGVCPTYASEYEDFIYRMASKLEASASGMGVGWSDEIKDEEKTISPNHESGAWLG
ncbi:protein SUPPRESSOR OF npr1-1, CONSTITUTIVE 1-like [Senna tora]|uniref:Protein SUPPRESSOR OF npr1-1, CONSTITUTIVE 1-like n=1 Tax=Senna tora TaxID=362788 RepID=A0A834WED7_9FABA|nr:protein SUPPRESSOR OF npr1-1, CONSTITUTIVE 1-like [Senna tora]